MKMYRMDVNLIAPVRQLRVPGGGKDAAGSHQRSRCRGSAFCRGSQQNRCCQSQGLGLIQAGKPRVPVKELNKGPVSDKKEIKLLDCWL